MFFSGCDIAKNIQLLERTQEKINQALYTFRTLQSQVREKSVHLKIQKRGEF